VETIVTTPIN